MEKPKGFDDFELRLGDVMRGERATLAKSLLDVQRELKIKASYIAAIENADASAFDTPGFVAGYVRSYARYLGMDPEWAFKRFCDEANFVVSHGMSAAASGPKPAKSQRRIEHSDPLANPHASFLPQREAMFSRIEPSAIGSIAVLIALLGGIGYGGWTVLQEVQKVQLAPVDQAPGVLAELDPLPGPEQQETGAQVEATLVLPDEDSRAVAEALDRLYRPQALDKPVLIARDGPIAAIDPRTVGALAGIPVVNLDIAEVETVVEEEPFEPGIPVVRTVADDVPEVELLAVRPSWVRVQTADGTVIFEKILDAGERYELPKTEEPPVLRAGNSGSLYFAVNGEAFGPAGQGTSVAKNVVLSANALREVYALADLSQDADLASIVAVAEAEQTPDPVPGEIAPLQ